MKYIFIIGFLGLILLNGCIDSREPAFTGERLVMMDTGWDPECKQLCETESQITCYNYHELCQQQGLAFLECNDAVRQNPELFKDYQCIFQIAQSSMDSAGVPCFFSCK